VALAAACCPSAAVADGGGATAPSAPVAKPRPGRAALLTSFSLTRPHLYLYGRAAKVRFRIEGRRAVPVRLRVLRAADRGVVTTLALGELAPGDHVASFTGTEDGILPEGRYLLHIAGRGLRRGPSASSTAELRFSHHRFPLAGAFDWGGKDARFGARRKGHRHQGQDLAAAEGTPIVAPRAGTVEAVEYQAGGAGHYAVLDGDGEDADYVFMHMRSGSVVVRAGQHVRTGQRIGEVGSTGEASGPHLHFEVWVGGWYAGGKPVDPLPLLQSWAADL
jgi:murein DD-endopeptidase MepM/ murein hydrolase activator NlpD